MTVGTPADAPAAGTVLVTSRIATTPRQYRVRVTISAEENFWAAVVHRATGGGARTSIFIPVTGALLGPIDLMTAYFADGDYVEVAVRDGVATLTGTVQVTVELL